MTKSWIAEHRGERIPVLVDLGYWDEAAAKRFGSLRATGLARRRFQRVAYDRLFVELPPRKVDAILASFPIVAGSTYFRATHHWRGLGKGEKVARVPKQTEES